MSSATSLTQSQHSKSNTSVMTNDTLIIHAGTPLAVGDNEVSCDAVPAIHMASSYLFKSAESILDVSRGKDGYVYRRYGNVNTTDLSTAVAQLEGGDDAVCLSCGMGAISSAFIAAGVLQGNKKILGPYSCYGSTYSLIKSRFANIAVCEFVDMGDTQAAIESIRRLRPDILFMETCSNPLTIVSDLILLAAEAKAVNSNAISMVDNTYTTPLLVKPLSLGVDVVIHSMTKYINGHGDVLAGLITSNNKEYMAQVKHTVIDFGTMLSPWDAWLSIRGLRTLGVRMSKISANVLDVAKYLESNCRISRVYYPGLPSHPQFQTVKKIIARALSTDEQQHGFPFSGMISFDINANVNDGPEDGETSVKTFLDSLRLISNQVSLGDVKSLASAPGLSTQQQVPLEDRLKTGINTTTIRLSVGMENVADICADIEQALTLAVPVPPTESLSSQMKNLSVGESNHEKRARLEKLYKQLKDMKAEVEQLENSIDQN